MNPLILAPVLEIGKSIIDRIIPDKEAARQAEADFLKQAMEGELKQTIAQLEINAKEAAHPSIFVAGWRPAFGWVGAASFLYNSVIQPLLAWYGSSQGWPVPPDLDMELMWVVVTGMLGIGGLRTYEKKNKVSK